LLSFASPCWAATEAEARVFQSLRLAINDLIETFGPAYPKGREYLTRLDALEKTSDGSAANRERVFQELKREALLENPLLDFSGLVMVRRRVKNLNDYTALGLPSNHECNSSLKRTGYDNEIAVLSPVHTDGRLRTLCRPPDSGYVGEVDLHWEADRLLFTQSDRESWKIWEMDTAGAGRRQLSRTPADVDCFDPCYVPDGKIVFGSTASYQSVPCWHGQKRVTNLYVMNSDGSGMRQLCFDQDHNLHPVTLPDGQVLYHRWDYTGINHIFMRQLMVMKPDGSGQRAVYGSNSWYPNSLYFPRPLPGQTGKLICILSGYHGVHRMGQLVLVDTQRGWHGADGLVKRISGRGDPITPMVRDNLVDQDWPKFLHPYPLSDKYFLVSCRNDQKSGWGIYLADVFDNLVKLREEPGYALLEPVPLKRWPKPPAIPSNLDLRRKDAVVYLHDVFAGPGLKGVPHGTAKRLRVLAYHFGYRGLGGPDKIGYGGPWEVMRILGTVPLEADGSAIFRVPANTPVAVQVLDAEGKAVQLMRSWFTAMPGEKLSCVGCHETPADAPPNTLALAGQREPRDITPWHGPARGFDFSREVQPVLDKHCVACHNAQEKARPDLRPEYLVKEYMGKRISDLGVSRLHQDMKKDTNGILKYTPAYEALIPYVRRVGIEDDVSLLLPGEYHADTSELIQMLKKGHQGVRLEAEAWDRIVTWIYLNAPCHGTWGEVYPVPDGGHRRRMELRALYGEPEKDPEAIPNVPRQPVTPVTPEPLPRTRKVQAAGWPFDAAVARRRQAADGPPEMTVDLGHGVSLKLVRIPPGEFVMGDATGEPDERPLSRVAIREALWMGACEVTNEQFRRFDPSHDCRYYQKRHARSDDQGLPLNDPKQPVVRVSWDQATAFCRWLSKETGMEFTLPTEAQWEYACRAGSAAQLSYGDVDSDFSQWANVGDKAFSRGYQKDGRQSTGGLEHLVIEGAALAEKKFSDGAIVTVAVGSYHPNPWGLYDMHGNAVEWTRTVYKSYPYRDKGRNAPAAGSRRVVRGGSFFDRPVRCRSAFRLGYPEWQAVYNVGFRVVCGTDPL